MRFDLHEVSYSYRWKSGVSLKALDRVNLGISTGECVGVIGGEGAGKSTLLHVMDALLRPETGKVCIDGNDMWNEDGQPHLVRQRIGLAFQFPEQHFFSQTVAAEMRSFPLEVRTVEMEQRAAELLDALGLPHTRFCRRSPLSLSIGEAHRLALASALVRRPLALLLDEPTAGLDGEGSSRVRSCLMRLRREGVTIVIASHDIDFLSDLVSRVVVLEGGCIRVDAPAEELLVDAQRLEQFGYDMPESVHVAADLRARGYVLEKRFYTPHELRLLVSGSASGREQGRNDEEAYV